MMLSLRLFKCNVDLPLFGLVGSNLELPDHFLKSRRYVQEAFRHLESFIGPLRACEVFPAAVARPETLEPISAVPRDASSTLRLISVVVTVCSSTAEAIQVEISLIRPMTSVT